jgi:hypothetical protein
MPEFGRIFGSNLPNAKDLLQAGEGLADALPSAQQSRANTSEATEGEAMSRSMRVVGKLATGAVVAGLILGPASADAKTVYPYVQATSSSQGAIPQTAADTIPQSVDTGRKIR